MLGIGAGRGVLAQGGQVAGYLAIEQRGLLKFGARHLAQPALVGLGQEPGQPLPVRAALLQPMVGDNS